MKYNSQTDKNLAGAITLSLTQAGQLLGIGRDLSYAMAKKGEFPVPIRHIVGRMRVRLRDIEVFLDEGGGFHEDGQDQSQSIT